eukprot:1044409-Rhodomonas_salina.1
MPAQKPCPVAPTSKSIPSWAVEGKTALATKIASACLMLDATEKLAAATCCTAASAGAATLSSSKKHSFAYHEPPPNANPGEHPHVKL